MMQLQQDMYDVIVAHGLSAFPDECCGFVAGKDGEAVKVFPMKNADASPSTYRMEPREQLQVQNEMDENGWDIYAIFHSHTHSEAYPSETDTDQAFYPDSYYALLSLDDRENPVFRAFRIVDREITEEEVKIV
jgi:proteasome lid subunit RPN8/RPN11